MPQNKLKQKVDVLTKTVKQLIQDLMKIDSLSRGTLTALQLHLGKEEWEKVLAELQERELKEQQKNKEKKLELDVE